MKELFDYISKRISLSIEAEKYIESISRKIDFKKNDLLIHQGQKVSSTYFVIKGCLRSYSSDKNGKEHNLQFAIKNWWISDFISLFKGELASLNVECITDSTLIKIKFADLEELHRRFPEFESFHRKNLENHVANLQKRLLNQLQLTAEERYSIFIEEYPDIEKYALNYHIASYLGITQQSLSRIRSEKKTD